MIPILALGAILVAAPALADTQMMIYNQGFAVVKETRTLTLPWRESETRVTDITAYMEPDSVVMRELRDPDGIRVRNHKTEAVEVRVVEHLYRGMTWEILHTSAEYRKTDGRTIEFRPRVPAGGRR